ncbi:MAG TPA: YggS family pyridoxal phosphate-dependent enzyme [Dehalococcoidia bacterium]|nr:YggS family pyridoxal phosphate-dependent enzyme [Dehalococcoidia bacterium]
MPTLTVTSRVHEVLRRVEAACLRAGRSPQEVTVVAVAKGSPAEAIREAHAAGLRHFGENRVQEAAAKRPFLADLEATWHMVGHLQTNKVKKALDLFQVVHSVDSLRLAQELSRRAQGPLQVLLEVNVVGEASKFGLAPEEVPPVAEAVARLPHLELVGLMTVAPLARDPEEVRPVFRRLRELGRALGLPHLSMGMSDDFEVAIEEGATMVRLGRAIFGLRPEA